MDPALEETIRAAAAEAGASAVATVYHDLSTGSSGAYHPTRWFHAASTIKLAVLLAVYTTVEGMARAELTRVHVRNQFTSLANGRYYRVDPGRDGNLEVHRYIGRTMRVQDLARHMITTSSNLATNVLVELLGPEAIRGALDRCGVTGVDFRRGVEDEGAWAAGINNRVTAAGLARLLRLLVEGASLSEEASAAMLEILHAQQFVTGIPAGLPGQARVANKTGEISNVAHDAGIVYLPEREPYVLVVLTEWPGDGDVLPRRALIARVSRLVMEHLTGGGDG
jgi:beta-lactamase class A